MHQLNGDRNALRVLQGMSEYISSFRCESGENVYYLSKQGRDRTGAEVARTKTTQANHYLMRADAFIHYAGNSEWKNEPKYTIPDIVTVIPDARFIHNQRLHFLEVDHLQHMNKNKEKIDKYLKLRETGAVQKKYGYFPRLVWVTVTETRKKQLAAWCEGLETTIHLWDDIK